MISRADISSVLHQVPESDQSAMTKIFMTIVESIKDWPRGKPIVVGNVVIYTPQQHCPSWLANRIRIERGQ